MLLQSLPLQLLFCRIDRRQPLGFEEGSFARPLLLLNQRLSLSHFQLQVVHLLKIVQAAVTVMMQNPILAAAVMVQVNQQVSQGHRRQVMAMQEVDIGEVLGKMNRSPTRNSSLGSSENLSMTPNLNISLLTVRIIGSAE
jgi:hypothetical protein